MILLTAVSNGRVLSTNYRKGDISNENNVTRTNDI
jgi:hypothetical protein